MMIKSKIVLCLILGLNSMLMLQGQTKFEVPQEVEFHSKEDYAHYEAAIVDAATWLEETDLDKEITKRQQVNSFVVKWISGSPTVHVEINDKLGKIYEKNEELMMLYIASSAKSQIESKDKAKKSLAIKAGLNAMMTVYKKGIDINKNKEMEKLIKLTGEGKLDEYIDKNFN